MRRNLLFIVILVVLCLLVVPVSADWLDSNWSYRKSHTINNTGSELTDYQMMFTVHRSSGTDTGCTVYIGTKCESDYDDIRFTADDGTTPLPYWIEDSDSSEADIWVNVSTINGSGDTTIYMYYGNSGASAVSSGEDTFPFFDDFSDGTVDTDKWGVTNTAVISSGELDCGSSSTRDDSAWSKEFFAVGEYVYRSRTKVSTYTETINWGFWRRSGNQDVAAFYTDVGGNNQHGTNTRNNGASTNTAEGTTYGTDYHIWAVRLDSTSQVRYYVDDVLIRTTTTNCPDEDMQINIGGYTADAHIYTDWVLIRKHAATEPTCSAWGSEESLHDYEITADFSGVPTSGYVPLAVYFTDNSTSTGNDTVVIDTWSWDFGDGSAGSSDQNPAHQYTTTGTYTVALTATNSTTSTTDTETKTDYITVSIDPSAPTADFVATPLCEDVGETIYFIDYSIGGGLYAWNWSFGDDTYSELRNPTHSYSANGTYDIGLTVWGANGTDTKTKTGYITIPCGAATPTPTPTTTTTTPTPTPTSSVTQGVLTEENITYIYSDEDQYVPLPLWLSVIGVMIAFFGHSIIFRRNTDLTATIACVLAFVAAGISNMIGYIDINVADINTTDVVVTTTIKAVHPPWLVWVMVMFAFVSIINVIYQAWKLYLKPKNWNEIYAKKYERY